MLLAAPVCLVVCLERSTTVSAAQSQQVQVSVGRAAEQDGQGYAITGFQIEYVTRPSGLPDVQEVARAFGELDVTLTRVEDGFVAPRPGVQAETISIRRIIDEAPTTIYASALSVLIDALVRSFEKQPQPTKVFVAPSPDDIDPATGDDLRGPNPDELLLLIAYDGPSFSIREFELVYVFADRHMSPDHPGLPPLDEVLAGAHVTLTRTAEGVRSEQCHPACLLGRLPGART